MEGVLSWIMNRLRLRVKMKVCHIILFSCLPFSTLIYIYIYIYIELILTMGKSDKLFTAETSNRLGSEVAPFGEADDSTALRLKENACAKPMSQNEGAPAESNRGNANIASEIHGCNDELFEPSSGAIDLIGTFDNHNKCTAGNSSYTDGGTSKLEFDPHLELSLRRTCMSTSNYQGTDGRHMLNHSNGSAFSW